MITHKVLICPVCGGSLKKYDNVKRIVRTKGRRTYHINVKRFYCKKCRKTHRRVPLNSLPYKQYEKEIIAGVLDGFINSNTLGYEDYPCEVTMIRWRKQYKNSEF